MERKIAILIGFMPNPRIYKRIELEKTMGELHLICWDRGNSMLAAPEGEGYTPHVISIPAGGDPVRRFIPYRRFFARSLKLLAGLRPDIVHVQGLDMLKIANAYRKKHNPSAVIVYEVADLHRLLVDKQKNPLRAAVQKYLRHEDKRLEKAYDLLVLTSEKYYEVYFSGFVPREKMLYMPNVPDLSAFESYVPKSGGDFTVGYIGAVRYKKQMENLIAAGKQCGVKLLIAGYEDEPRVIEPLCAGDPNIEWVGRFDFSSRAAQLYGRCDVMYSVYNADMHNVRVALPNKLYEAVWCEMPLIVARGTYLAELTEAWGVGYAVDHSSPDELIGLINALKSGEKGRDIPENCRRIKPGIDLAKNNENLRSRLEAAMSKKGI
ncbi:MAG: glycosyltransferase family 4 protein [Ruminococcaceae bacterium]|nr:glycosyltransferase family 4 protein [Oscillospiraceae bacterium]